MELKPNLAKAVIAVMKEIKGVEKSSTIGTGSYAYKGVPDMEVKKLCREAMMAHGLCILPISVTPTVKIERWEEQGKTKQSIFTDVATKYLLLHDSGESVELSGYGHGVDNQDKGAGKATTYALKYLLLYLFLIPTVKIDDADNNHSNDKETPQTKAPKAETKAPAPAGKVAMTKEKAKSILQEASTLDILKKLYSSLTVEMQAEMKGIKDEMKTKLSTKK